MEINLINIFITLIGYFGAIYTKDIIVSIKKQKLILRKLTSYNNLIKKNILSQKDIAIIYCNLVDKHIKERVHYLESFDKFKNFLDEVLPDESKQLVLAEYFGSVFIRREILKLEKMLVELKSCQV